MEAEAWKALKQAAIRFELKTGLNVHVSACRGERPVYEFTSSGKTNTDSRLVSRQSRSQTDRSDFIPMSMPVHHPALYHSKDIILESKRELPDENENTEEDIDFEYESENDVLEFEEEEPQSRPRETPPSEGISIKTRAQNRRPLAEVASSAPISIPRTPRTSHLPVDTQEEKVAESYWGSALHRQHMRRDAQY